MILSVWKTCVEFLFRRIILVLIFLVTAGVIGAVWHQARLADRLLKSTALEHAKSHSDVIREFRSQYTEKVVAVVSEHGIEITHDYRLAEKLGKSIPLPATLSMELGNAITAKSKGAQTLLYSPYPFPYPGRERLEVRDQFARNAWAALSKNPNIPFYRFEDFRGRSAIRYATADLMRSSCVPCHNSHPDSPKTDWQEGDVRGVLEVTLPLDTAEEQTAGNLTESIVWLGGFAAISLLVIGLVLSKLRRIPKELEWTVQKRTKALAESNERLECEISERIRAETRVTRVAQDLRRSNRELEHREAELIQAKQFAEAADRSKSEFLANMSHELRTPLHGILSYSRFGIDESLTAEREEILDYFQTIGQSGDNLLALVNDLLDLAKLESGKMTFDFQPCDLAGLIAAVADEFASLTAERNIRILFEPPVGEIVVALDQERIGQVLRNLLSNSVKFSPDGGTVHVSIGETERGPRVTVRDSGPGIPADELELVFDKFAQSSKTKTGAGGTGLGLAICREIMDGHHGRIWAENTPEGGAILSLEIPADLQPVIATDDFVDTGNMP